MESKLVPVFHALTVDDAQRLADILSERGIEAFVENTEAPLYGMTQGPSAHIVYVYEQAKASAREVVRKFEADWHPGVPRDEQLYEETGLELPDDPTPSEDSPNEENRLGNERLDEPRPGPAAPEVADLVLENPNQRHLDVDPNEDPIVGFGPDRGLTEEPEFESPEVEEQPIDELHVDTGED